MKYFLNTMRIKPIEMIFIIGFVWAAASCSNAEVTESPTSQPTSFGSGIQTTTSTATIQPETPSPTPGHPHPTSTPVPVTRTPYPTRTPVPTTIVPTSVPPGVFPLIFYPPLVLVYDVTQWEDTTPYDDRNAIVKNVLQSQELSSCRIGVQGPTNFNDPSQYEHESVQLGNIRYEAKIFSDTPDREVTTFYIAENKSIEGYEEYDDGLPVLTVQSKEEEWEGCRGLAEKILSTLSLP